MDAPSVPASSAPPTTPGSRLTGFLARTRRDGLSRAALAYCMVVLSAQGAAVAFWIARSEQQSVALHRQLTRGQMVELSLRQQILGDWSFRSALEARQRDHQTRGASLRDSATRVRAEDPQQAGQYEMLAQQEYLLSQLTSTLATPFRAMSDDSDVPTNLDQQVRRELAVLGFSRAEVPGAHADPADPAATRSPAGDTAPPFASAVGARELPVWKPFSEAIHALHERVPRLALGVVLFVLALVCLTAADLSSRWRRLANLALVAGAASAVFALVAVLVWDPSAWLPLAVASAFGLALGAVFRSAGLFAYSSPGETPHPPELEPRGFLGVHVTLKHRLHLREQVLVGITAVTVLLSSTVGWWFAGAQTHAGEATHRAFASEVQLNNLDGERWLQASARLVTPSLELFHARLRCAFASQAAAQATQSGSPAAPRLQGDRDRDCKVLTTPENERRAELVDRVDFDRALAPGAALFAEVRNQGPFNAAHLYALADGYISEAEQWEAKAATYVLGLTLFAIALYLISQAMGMGEGAPSTVLAVCGLVLALGTFGYAARVYLKPVMPVPSLSSACAAPGSAVEVAATHYGRAKAKLDMAATGPDYQAAFDLLSCAIEARPGFGRAHYDRARAASRISLGDVDNDYSSFPTLARVPEIQASHAAMIEQLERSHWVPTPHLLNSYGWLTFLAALTAADAAGLDASAALFERGLTEAGIGTPDGVVDAVKLKAASPGALDTTQVLYTNLALARLARGDRDAALRAYQAGVDGLGLAGNRALVASVQSDLNILEAYCGRLHGVGSPTCGTIAAGIKDAHRLLITSRVAPPDVPSRAKLTNVRAWARASRVGWRGDLAGFDPERDSLAVVWSAWSEEWKVWRVVQPLSYPAESKRLAGLTKPEHTALYRGVPSHCLPPGRYRAEFYLNGERVALDTPQEVDVSGFRDYRSRELDVALCLPTDWTSSSVRAAGGSRHLVQSFATSQKRGALYLFTLFSPINQGDWDGAAMQQAWTLMKQWGKATASDEAFRAAIERFEGCDKPIPPGTVLNRVWRSEDGLVRVAFVIGDAAPNGQACQVLESIGGYYNRVSSQVLGVTR